MSQPDPTGTPRITEGQQYGKCDTCGTEGALYVYALPGVPVSVANCKVCFETNCYPWGVLVANTASIGGLYNAADWWKDCVQVSLARLGKTYAELAEAVAKLEDNMAGYG